MHTSMVEHLAIIPAYNEERAIASVVNGVRAHAPGFDILVVDDGSTDATAEAAASASAWVVRHPFNLGIGGAVQTGYRFALEHGHAVAVQIDGDGQHDPQDLPRLLACLREGHVDMVTGSRFLDPSGHGYRSSVTRRAGIRLFSWILSRIVGRTVTDPTSGFRMTNRRGIELFARDYPHDYPEVEAVLLLHAHRLEAAEIPVAMRARDGGSSSIVGTQPAYYMAKVLLAVLVGLFRARPNVEPGDAAAVRAERAI